jgi:hypothetical protein
MASVGSDQFFSDNKFDETTVTPKRRMPKSSQISSMSTPQSTTVAKGAPDPTMQDAARRRLKKMQQPQDPNNQYS